jgi:hypothetical protein
MYINLISRYICNNKMESILVFLKETHNSNSILLGTNIILLLVYIISFAVVGNTINLFTIPWSWRDTFIDVGVLDKITYNDPKLVEVVLQQSGCSHGNIVLGDGMTWLNTEKSGLCVCLYRRFYAGMELPKTQEELEGTILSCLLSSKAVTEKGLFDNKDSIWASNTAVLVALWNIISTTASFASISGHIPYVSPIIYAVLLAMMIPIYVIIPAHLTAIYTIVILTLFSTVLAIVYLPNETNKNTDKDTIIWLQLTYVLPISMVLFNITMQRRDILYIIGTVIIVISMVFGTMGAYYFNKVTTKDVEYHVSNYICICNIISTFLIYFISYENMDPNLSGNIGVASGLVLFILLASLQLQNSLRGSQNTDHAISVNNIYHATVIMETISRFIITIGMLLDFRAVSM